MERCLSDKVLENARLWLKKLEKNEREVGVERLKTAYANGYAKMIEYTKAAIVRAEIEYLLTAVPKESRETARRAVSRKPLPVDPVLNTYDLDLGFELLIRDWYELQMEYYVPYWLRGTRGSGRRFYNVYCDMWWDDKRQYWCSEDRTSAGIFWPPTEELCKKRFAKIMAEIPQSSTEIQKEYANRLRVALFS